MSTESNSIDEHKVAIIGAGPAGLFCSTLLLEKGYQVDLYDQSSGLAKKFLIAGNGGLNLTHSENIDNFTSKYYENKSLFKELLSDFSPNDLREFCDKLGVETFIGTSGRVFPKKLKAAEMLLNWQKYLNSFKGFRLLKKHKLKEILKDKTLTFEYLAETKSIKYHQVILALGGGSWKKTGSDGSWVEYMESLGIEVAQLKPMNCGFETNWSEFLKKKKQRLYLKNISIKFGDKSVKAEMVITNFGIEGTAVYALSKYIREELERNNKALITIDLKPDLTLEEIKSRFLKKKAKESMSNFLRRSIKLNKDAITLLNENKNTISPELIKSFKVTLNSVRPIDEAISTAGGVCLEGLTTNFESKEVQGLYFCGEMLDYEAPTGGYLLQGCFSTAFRVTQNFPDVTPRK